MNTIEFAVNPYRFSDDPAAMVAFLETLGMRKVITTASDSFALLRAGAGWVGVHAAGFRPEGTPAGETQLVLLTRSAVEAADQLRARGVTATVWDESYGRHAGVVDPTGGGVWINEYLEDLYGYLEHDDAPDQALSVTMVRPSADGAADRAFFGLFGFEPEDGGNQWWQALSASAGSGAIGLHHPMPGEEPNSATRAPFAERTATARLGLRTTEDLPRLAERLTRAGYAARVVTGDLRAVHVQDPDGCEVEIHPAS